MKIYNIGCSHTSGTKLSLPNSNDQYSKVLALLYNGTSTMAASPGDSNEKIYRQAIYDLTDSKYDVAIFQWTDPGRFETAESNYWYQHRPFSPYQYDKHAKKLDKYYKDIYKDIPRWQEKLNAQIIGLNTYCESLSIRPIHMCWRPLHPSKMTNMIVSEYEWLIDPYQGLWKFLLGHGFKEAEDGHFKADAHITIAFWLKTYIDTYEQPILSINIVLPERREYIYNA